MLMVSCNGGGGIVVIDPAGTWTVGWTFTPPPGLPDPGPMPINAQWVITGGPTTYEVMLPGASPSPAVQDVGPLTMTLNGSSFTITGSHELPGVVNIDYAGSGTLTSTTLTGTWTETSTDALSQETMVVMGDIAGTKQP
jgi:hypothetical protein